MEVGDGGDGENRQRKQTYESITSFVQLSLSTTGPGTGIQIKDMAAAPKEFWNGVQTGMIKMQCYLHGAATHSHAGLCP